MALQYRIMSIPLINPGDETEQLNHFMRSHRIISVQKEITRSNDVPFCSFIIEYMQEGDSQEGIPKLSKIDYRDLLTPEDFAVFSRLREARKNLAKTRGLPVYAICSNEQLANMARDRPANLSELKKIPGIGESKASLVEEGFLPILRGEPDT